LHGYERKSLKHVTFSTTVRSSPVQPLKNNIERTFGTNKTNHPMKRKLLLTLIACGTSLALCPALLAQDASPAPSTAAAGGGGQQGGRRGGGMSIDRLTTELTLTPDEVTKITPILSDFRTQVQTIRADTSLSQTDRMSKMKDARDTMTAAVNAILTPDQQTKFAALQAKRGRRGGGGGGGGADSSPAASATP